ncbi:MAG: cache domain-containing protein, partial [SAR324 cluster bacterium]|nr:cache domain-containing protein [SAR324 cluster bacterium]
MKLAMPRILPSWRKQSDSARAPAGGGRLLRRTFVSALVLVSGGLISSGGVELYFRYQESIAGIGTLQREMAQGAAFKIHQFVADIEKTMRATTQTRENVTSGLTESFRFHLIKMMKVAPAIATVQVYDARGEGVMTASRVHLVDDKDLQNSAKDEAFLRARSGKAYYGPVYFVRQSEPYMRIAVPIELLVGDVVGVLIAEVNLKYIREVVTQIKVGKAGYAYVVSREGDLIAHPDISLVLQMRNLKELGQVQAALSRSSGTLSPQPNLTGQMVFPAYAAIPDVGWAVLVERPAEEAIATLYASIARTALLLLVGLGMAVLASLVIGRRVVNPVRVLREGAARIGAGELNHRIDVRTGDELQALAEEFNQMAGQLQAERTGLEQRVEERTYELAETLEQQTAIADILRVISSSPTDLAPVFDTILEHSTRLCDAELGFLFLHEDGLTEAVAFRGGTPEFMKFHKERGKIRPHPDTQLGQIIAHGRHVQLSDYTAELRDRLEAAKDEQRTQDAERLGKLLAAMESEHVHAYLGLPLLKEQTVVGAIVIYRREVREFTDKQIALARTFADQAVIAIENARLQLFQQAGTEALGRSVEELRALGEVSQAVSSTLELQTVLTTVVSR